LFSQKSLITVFILVFSLILTSQVIGQDYKAKDLVEMSLEELMDLTIVTAGRHKQKASSVAATINTLTEKDIHLSGATNLAEILRNILGVSIARHPGNFPQYVVNVRGFHSDFMSERALIMINGVPVYHPHTGGYDPGWISLSGIKKIEIIKGPVSSLYGANAFGGLINVITKSGEGADFFADASLGAKTTKNLDNEEYMNIPIYSATIGGGIGKMDFLLSADGFLNDAGFRAEHQSQENMDVFGNLGFQLNDKNRFQVFGALSLDRIRVGFENAPDPMKNDFMHITAKIESEISDNYSVMVRGYLNDFSNYVKYNDELNKYETNGQVFGVEIQNTIHTGDDNTLIFGGDFHQDKASMTTWEFDWGAGDPPPVKQAGYDETTTNTVGCYIQEEYRGIDKLLPTIGVRYDHNSEFGGAISPRIGLSYQFDKNLTSYLTITRAFRAPNYNELYIDGFGKIGNPELEPEYTMMYEVGLKGTLAAQKNKFQPFSVPS